MDWIIGALCALFIAGAAYWKRSLSLSGAVAAVIMGTVYYAAGNLFWFGILILFFVTSSIFSKLRGDRKAELERSYAKSGRRDAGQVFANGGLGMVACILNALWPNPAWAFFFIGSMAAVTADTWATEWGGLSKRPPRSVLNWRVVPPGTSGGISSLGSMAALIGAGIIGGAAWLLLGWTNAAQDFISITLWKWIIIGAVSGFAGAMADSLLGATVQKMYRCKQCGKVVEVGEHCGQATLPERGWSWMSNDAVNIISSAAAGFIAWGLGVILA
ncbi:DUF92 domain-containing protein [Paenibacillus sp. D2_2]|uniref:DUF92 domain-containing protein n=1 Tax=Paenibacillus sp. D2_2 TaxID=3073092 RepID=UPI0028168253|nr:DUF92 domain-containing protein [Paenibacillus sp. D2_2]WMT43550.1 DUF92 domain-containing protein [Paenibacillus sp. D2_2]